MNAPIVISIAKDKCKGCQLCVFFCPSKNLILSQDLNKKGIKYAKVKDAAKCTGCGMCFLVCPDCCIEIREE
ncbi:MAG: 4Fe-4S binding protein [Candidatus Omnitrophota bacterium]